MPWVLIGVALLAAWYFTSQTGSVVTPPGPSPSPAVPQGPTGAGSAQTGKGGTPATGTQSIPGEVDVSPHPTGSSPASNPSNATTPQAQASMNAFAAYVKKYQHSDWNGLLTVAQWNYYYAQGSNTPTSASHEVGVGSGIAPSQPINIQTYWSLRAAKGLSL